MYMCIKKRNNCKQLTFTKIVVITSKLLFDKSLQLKTLRLIFIFNHIRSNIPQIRAHTK